jgi:uncharacterized membrane protein
MLTFTNFAIIMATVLGAIALFAASIVLFGTVGIVVAIVILIILLAAFLYSGERLKEIEREEERQEAQVKSDYSYVKRYTQTGRRY